MLKPHARLVLWLAVSLLAGCSRDADQALQIAAPNPVEASYRLTFNDSLVGHALFVLHVGQDHSYRLEAFTVPAGEMTQTTSHEVLETSEGSVGNGQVRPRRFTHSIVDGETLQSVSLEFDWQDNALWLADAEQRRRIALLPDTHDHLSYLLAARNLAVRGDGAKQIQVAAADATEENRLEVEGTEQVELVHDAPRQAVRIRRITPATEDRRTLWVAPDYSPLPLRIQRTWEGNTVDMLLESLTRASTDPR